MTDDMRLVLFGAIIGVFATIISGIVSGAINYIFEIRKSQRESIEKFYYLGGKLSQLHLPNDIKMKEDPLYYYKEFHENISKIVSGRDSNHVSMMIGYTEAKVAEIDRMRDELKAIRMENAELKEVREKFTETIEEFSRGLQFLQEQWEQYLRQATENTDKEES